MKSCGKKQKKNVEGLQGMSVVELRERVSHLYPYLTKLHTFKRQELCDILSRGCDNIGGLTNKKNSCYLDSILMGLFHNHNPYLRDKILKREIHFDNPQLQDIALDIQRMLNKVNAAFIDGKKGACTRLRVAFQKFDEIYSTEYGIEQLDWKEEQLEPTDVIKFFIRVFKIPNDCKYRFQSTGINGKTKTPVTNDIRETTFADAHISADLLYDQKEVRMKQFIPVEKTTTSFDNDNLWKPGDVEFKKKLVIKSYLKAPMFIVHVSRIFGDEKIKTPFIPEKALKLKENKHILHLRSVVVHHGQTHDSGHYTCYLLCQNTWFHYDDVNFSVLEKIGDFDKMLKHKNSFVLKNGVDFVYF